MTQYPGHEPSHFTKIVAPLLDHAASTRGRSRDKRAALDPRHGFLTLYTHTRAMPENCLKRRIRRRAYSLGQTRNTPPSACAVNLWRQGQST